jgi:hypothetical protein
MDDAMDVGKGDLLLLMYKRIVNNSSIVATVVVRACDNLTGLPILFPSVPYGIAEIASPEIT